MLEWARKSTRSSRSRIIRRAHTIRRRRARPGAKRWKLDAANTWRVHRRGRPRVRPGLHLHPFFSIAVQNSDDASGKVVEFPYFLGRKGMVPGIISRIFLIPRLLFFAWRDHRSTKGNPSPPHGKSFENSGHTSFHHNLEALDVIQRIDVADDG